MPDAIFSASVSKCCSTKSFDHLVIQLVKRGGAQNRITQSEFGGIDLIRILLTCDTTR